nr:MAG TPA: hypothetical protein [Bacteriophage sp.]
MIRGISLNRILLYIKKLILFQEFDLMKLFQ